MVASYLFLFNNTFSTFLVMVIMVYDVVTMKSSQFAAVCIHTFKDSLNIFFYGYNMASDIG